jgi:5-methylcytosine-specific restriction endonuclease McrA
MDDTKKCWWCGVTSYTAQIDLHHVFKRGSHPHLIEEPKNLMPLCRTCHTRTENDNNFYKIIQTMWCNNTAWHPYGNKPTHRKDENSVDDDTGRD